MNNAPHLITVYQQLLDLSHGMLRLAADGEWDDLITKEVDYVSAVQTLARSTEAAPPSASCRISCVRYCAISSTMRVKSNVC